MSANVQHEFLIDREKKTITVKREFSAPVTRVWSAWTESNWLDQWWAPRPWKATTKSMDFREGGIWIYAMMGPEGETHWSKMEYTAIRQQQSFSAHDAFCDEKGITKTDFPVTNWTVAFSPNAKTTLVTIQLEFQSDKDMDQLLEMGFKEGFLSALGNLEDLL